MRLNLREVYGEIIRAFKGGDRRASVPPTEHPDHAGAELLGPAEPESES